jgi:ornithine cyclodeaminase/alanine dehydrogenase-like protein (mu-crystallin family)
MPRPHAELGEIVAGKKPGRLNAGDRVIDFNLGIALHDVAVADMVYNKAVRSGIGSSWTLMSGEPPYF